MKIWQRLTLIGALGGFLGVAGVLAQASYQLSLSSARTIGPALASGPIEYTVDGSQSTGFKVAAGTTYTNLTLTLTTPATIWGLQIDGSGGNDSVVAQVEYDQNGTWRPFVSGSRLPIHWNGGRVQWDVALDRAVTGKVRLHLMGADLSTLEIDEVRVLGRDLSQHVQRLKPKTVSASDNSSFYANEYALFDGNPATYWLTEANKNWSATHWFVENWAASRFDFHRSNAAWLQGFMTADLGGATSVESLRLYVGPQARGQYKLEVLKGASWVTIDALHAVASPAAGWVQYPINDTISQVRLSVATPSSSQNEFAGFGELEIWGIPLASQQTYQSPAEGSAWIPGTVTDSDPTVATGLFNWDTALKGTRAVASVAYDASQTTIPGINLNGRTLSANRTANTGNLVVADYAVPYGLLITGDNFFQVNPNASGVVAKARSVWIHSHGAGGSTGSYYSLSCGPNGIYGDGLTLTVPTGGTTDTTEISLGKTVYLKQLELLGATPTAWRVSAWVNGAWVALNQLSTYVYSGDYLTTKLRLEGGTQGLAEIQLWGSPAADQPVRVDIAYPQDQVEFPIENLGFQCIYGVVTEPTATVKVNGITAKRYGAHGEIWWLELTALHLETLGDPTVTVTATMSDGRSTSAVTTPLIQNSAYQLTVNTGPFYVTASNFAVTGTYNQYVSKVYVQGTQVSASSGTFSQTVSLNPGLNVIRVELRDKNTNVIGRVKYVKVYRQTKTLSLALTSHPSTVAWNQSTIVLQGTVDGLAPVTVSIKAGSATPVAATVTGTQWTSSSLTVPSGTTVFTITAKDGTNATATQTVTVTRDTTPPTISIATPVANTAYQGPTIHLSGPGSDASSFRVFVNGTVATVANGTWSLDLPFSDGNQTINVYAIDAAGNTSATLSRSFVADSTPPVDFTITANVSGWTNNNRPTITFATTDATTGMDHYEYAVGNGSFTTLTSPFQLPTVADGEPTLFVKAFDKVGNVKLSSLQLHVDSSTPATPSNFLAVPGPHNITASWTSLDDGENFETYRVERNPAWPDGVHTVVGIDGAPAYGDQAATDSGLTDGTSFSYRVWAVDRAGNSSPKTDWAVATAGIADTPINGGGETVVRFQNVLITLPAGSTDQTITRIQVTVDYQGAQNFPSIRPFATPVYQFRAVQTANGVDTVLDHVTFQAPVTVQITYDQQQMPDGYDGFDLRSFYYNTFWERWVAVDFGADVVDPIRSTVRFQTTHFSDFSLLPTKENTLSLKELRETPFSNFSSVRQAPVQVDAASGIVNTSFHEFTLPGRNGLDLNLTRVYDSASAQNLESWSNGDGLDFVVGAGWRLSLPHVTLRRGDSILTITGLDGVYFTGSMSLINAPGTYEGHDGSDCSLVVNQNPRNLVDPWFTIVQKDGRRIDFDTDRRVMAIYDSFRSSKISFSRKYVPNSNNNYDLVWTIVDSMERTITMPLWKGAISSINVTNQDGTAGPKVTYSYDNDSQNNVYLSDWTVNSNDAIYKPYTGRSGSRVFPDSRSNAAIMPLLVKAVDVGNREWRYGYWAQRVTLGSVDEPFAATSDQVTGEIKHGATVYFVRDTHSSLRDVRLLNYVSGLGAGTTRVSYGVNGKAYSEAKKVEQTKSTYEYLDSNYVSNLVLATRVTVGLADSEAVQSADYGYDLNVTDENKVGVQHSTVNDQRTTTTTDYELHYRSDLKQVKNFPNTVTVKLTGTSLVLETQTQTWNPDLSRLTKLVRTRSATNSQTTEYTYDGWGNAIKATTKGKVGDRTSEVEERWSYYNTGSTTLSLGRADLPIPIVDLTPTNGARNLIAVHQRRISGVRPGNPDEVLDEADAYTYNSLGQLIAAYKLNGQNPGTAADWSPTTYAYYTTNNPVEPNANVIGMLRQVTSPLGQVTQFDYNYKGTPGLYTRTTRQLNVQINADPAVALASIETVEGYDYLTGNLLWTQTPNGLTQKAYTGPNRFLGRVTQVIEPNGESVPVSFPTTPWTTRDRTTNPVTDIEYDDTALTTKVTNPIGLITTYQFDNLGRLQSVTKKADAEVITTQLDYDVFGQVVALHGPVSNHETDTARTLENLVTRYTYDALGRVATTRYPGANDVQFSTFDYSNNQLTAVDETKNTVTQILDWNDRPLSTTRYLGSSTLTSTAYYDGIGRPIAQVDGEGNLSTQWYNALGQTEKKVGPWPLSDYLSGLPPQASETVYGYDGQGNLTQTTQNGSRQTNVLVNGLGWPLQITQPVTVNGALTAIVTKTGYDQNGNKTSETTNYEGETGTAKLWTYDAHNRVLKATDEAGQTTSYSYDFMGNKLTVVDPRQGKYSGESFTLTKTYNRLGRLVAAQLPTSNTALVPAVSFTYDGQANLLSQTDPNGQVSSFTYDFRNRKLTSTQGGATTRSTYDDAGRLISTQSPGGRVDTQSYDNAGRLTQSGNNVTGFTSYTYDANDRQLTVTDGNNHATTYTYDPAGRVLKRTDPLGNVYQTDYDRFGQVTQTTDPEQNTRTMTYDELGRLLKTTTNLQSATNEAAYDAFGKVTQSTNPRGTVTTFSYTQTHLVNTRTRTNGSSNESLTYTYDEAGAIMTATGSNGVSTAYNLVGGSYRPDPYDLVLGTATTLPVTPSPLAMSYTYDESKRLTGVTYPDASAVNYSYNTNDQLTSVSDWVATSSWHYDTAGRLTNLTLANGVQKTITYDAQDQLQTLSYQTSAGTLKQYQFGYDQAGNILTKNQNGYGYDATNQLTRSQEQGWFQQQPQDLSATVGLADSDYQGTKVLSFGLQPTNSVSLDMARRSLGVDFGQVLGVNQIKLTPQATAHRVRPEDLSVWAATSNVADPVSGQAAYTKVTGWTFQAQSDGSIVLQFPTIFIARYLKINTIWNDWDPNGQPVATYATFQNSAQALIQVWTLRTNQTTQYTYDRNGNRTSLTVDGQTKTSTYYQNANGGNTSWLLSDGSWFYQYDANGNVITKAKNATVNSSDPTSFVADTTQEYWTYSWDLSNRLIEVKHNGGSPITYAYDADDHRVSRTDSNGTTVYAYGRTGALAYQKNLTINTARTFAYASGQIVGWTDTQSNGTQTKYFATTDHQGSVTQITDASGAVVWQSEYQPFGTTAGVEGTYTFNGGYTGADIDPDTGLIYLWHRWQDPGTGRFISEDPAMDGDNWFVYGGNNPLVFTDPTGLIRLGFSTDDYNAFSNFWNSPSIGLPAPTSHSSSYSFDYFFNPGQPIDPNNHVVFNTGMQTLGIYSLGFFGRDFMGPMSRPALAGIGTAGLSFENSYFMQSMRALGLFSHSNASNAGNNGSGGVDAVAGAAPASPSSGPGILGDIGDAFLKAAQSARAEATTGKITNGYNYTLDELNRVTNVQGTLSLNKANGRNTAAQLSAGGTDRLATDQGGHYIARIFNGPMEEFNHFAQNGNFNQGVYKALENQWAKALESGSSVRVNIVPNFVGNSLRPQSLNVQYWIDNVMYSRTFINASGGR